MLRAHRIVDRGDGARARPRARAIGPLGPPGEPRPALGVHGRDEQATAERDTGEELTALAVSLLLVVGLPEPVLGHRAGRLGGGEQERSEPGEASGRQRESRPQLDGTVDPDE
mgnify:CR=1 FL=1